MVFKNKTFKSILINIIIILNTFKSAEYKNYVLFVEVFFPEDMIKFHASFCVDKYSMFTLRGLRGLTCPGICVHLQSPNPDTQEK